MDGCDRCGAGVVGPRQCAYCGHVYCRQHRLPEQHDCVGVRNWEWRGRRFESGFKGF